MEIIAQAKYVRVSPRKMLILAQSIRKMQPKTAVVQLTHLNKSGAEALKQVVASALNNAQQKNIMVDQLLFKEIQILNGSAMKRFRAVSRGSAHTYKKRMSHVKVVLTDEKQKTKEEQQLKISVKAESSSGRKS